MILTTHARRSPAHPRRLFRSSLPTAVMVAVLAAVASAAGVLPDTLVSFTPGLNAGFGQSFSPTNVLTGPDGGDTPPNVPNERPEDLLSLGDGGSIILAWDSSAVIVDGAGADFTVFENTLETLATGVPFVEAGIVAVSQDGADWFEFPFAFLPPVGFDPGDPFAIPLFAVNYSGLAGTRATLSTPVNGVDPGDPAVSGGNSFDLATVGLAWARYVRITDAGAPGQAWARTGSNGLEIFDLGQTASGSPVAGFDLDAIVAVNTGPLPAAASAAWTMLE